MFARLALLLCAAVPLFARDLPPIDEFAKGTIHPDAAATVAGRASIPFETRLNVPTFMWAKQSLAAAPTDSSKGTPRKGKKEEAAARAHLGRNASRYQLDLADVDAASLVMVHNTGKGPVIVKLRQQVRGIEIFREEINIVMNRNLELVGIGGYITSASTPDVRGKDFAFDLSDRAAALAALTDLTGVTLRNNDLKNSPSREGYDYFTLDPANGVQLEEPIRLKKVLFHLQSGLEAGYYVEVAARDLATMTTDYYAYVISAADGHVLYRNTLGADAGTAYTYRVWAAANGYPFDSPAGNAVHPKVNAVPDGYQAPLLAQSDITVANFPFSMNDPWLPAGATETLGNNVDAYSDLFSPDGYSPVAAPATPATGDFRATTTGANAFQHTYDMTQPSHHIQRQAATTQLFVNVNFLHDWFYDAGFDEAAGNAQQDNYGRGGVAGDRLKAEAQDYGGTNNANMYTPADGASPRMQMYMFNLYGAAPFFSVVSPAAAAGKRTTGTATFGPQSFDVTADMIYPAPAHACTALTNAAQVAGKIVLVDREPTSGEGACSIATKLTNIAAANPAGIVLVNLSSWPDLIVTLSDSMIGFVPPVMTITWNGAVSIKTQLDASNPVVGHMARDPYTLASRDGTIDNQIVAHEWGHYLSNRLIGNGGGLTNNQGRSMGEGWSDFLAMMLTVRPDDVATASNATWNGTYATGTFAFSGGADGGSNQGYYFGVRRYPYSTDLTKNPLTFKHIQTGVPLPAGAPVNSNGYPNAEVHNSGEMWANVLWECYAALLRDTQGGSPRLTFQQAQDRMKEYLVASLKLTPVNPTFIEARDALLAAAAANDATDYTRFYQAFAARGMGVSAIAPDRYSVTHVGVVESFSSTGYAKLSASSLSDAGGSCDGDGILDHGETGQLSITLKNTGTVDLNGIAGTVSTLTPGITFPGGGAVTFPNVAPGNTTTAIVPVSMAAGVNAITTVSFTLLYSHASIETSPLTAEMQFRGNADVITTMLATDAVDTPSTPWTLSFGTPPGSVSPWARRTLPAALWHVENAAITSDERLESPPMTISAGGSLKIEFDHLYGFEYYCCNLGWDGGVVEMSRNGGAWVDVGGSAYNGSVMFEPEGGNPLQNRPAFVGSSESPLHTTLTPAVAAGDVVRVRFRIGTDYIIGAYGWDIDNITFTGVLETPFDALVVDAGCPTKTTTTRLTSNGNPMKLGSSLQLTASILAAGNPTGTVTFFDGATNLGTVAPVNRVATLSTSSLTAGTHLLTAQYGGAAGFTPSTSSTLAQIIDNCSAAPVISSVSGPASIPGGGTATLSVTATGGVTYEWFAGSAPSTANPVGTGATIDIVPTASPSLYWVRVANACGSANSTTLSISVVPPTKFYTVTPCRAYDSRQYYNGELPPNINRYVEPYYCNVPYGAKAVSVNVTVVGPSASGWLTLFPTTTSIVPPTSTLNYQAGKTRANNAIVAVGSYGSMYVNNGGSQPVHFIIDVNGYFY